MNKPALRQSLLMYPSRHACAIFQDTTMTEECRQNAHATQCTKPTPKEKKKKLEKLHR
jgi:hypothetical protein